jgi:hypothetical protein
MVVTTSPVLAIAKPSPGVRTNRERQEVILSHKRFLLIKASRSKARKVSQLIGEDAMNAFIEHLINLLANNVIKQLGKTSHLL